MTSVEIRSLCKRFGKGRKQKNVLSNLDLEIEEGRLFSLLGVNGAGKTTLIKILSTLLLPDSGRVEINGYDVEKEAGQVRCSVGIVASDERSFFWRLTAVENLRFFGVLQNMGGQNLSKRIDELIGLVGLEEAKNKSFNSFSSGMKQRLSIARGLLHNPPILLMDEPTKGLDPVKVIELRKFIRETLVDREGKTILLATHDLKEAEEISNEVGILHEGTMRVIYKRGVDLNYNSLKQKFLEIVEVQSD